MYHRCTKYVDHKNSHCLHSIDYDDALIGTSIIEFLSSESSAYAKFRFARF